MVKILIGVFGVGMIAGGVALWSFVTWLANDPQERWRGYDPEH